MARTVAIIEQQIYDQMALQPTLASIVTNPSRVANWKTFVHCIAVCIAVFEQIIDVFKSDIEVTVANAPVGSEPFIQAKVFEFQYDATTPQILDIVNFSPQYNPIDPTKRIVTRASIKTTSNNRVLVKFGVNDPPVAASSLQITALQAYLTNGGDGTYAGRGRGLGFAGIDLVASSIDADRLYISGQIFYNGQYSSSIQNDVVLAINNYLANLPFDGSITIIGINKAIKAVTGVNDLLLNDIASRPNALAFNLKTFLRQAQTDIIPLYPTLAGYIIQEDTGGQTYLDTLTFVASA